MNTVSSLEVTTSTENETIAQKLKKEKVIYNSLSQRVKRKLLEFDNENTFVKISEGTNTWNSSNKENSDHDFLKIEELAKSFETRERQKYFSKIQKWVGYILEIHGDNIKAKLNDLNNPTTFEIAEFEMNEIPFEDRELVSKGAGFYWSLGYINDNGQIEKKSLIRFQRTKPWEESDLNRIVDGADELYNKLNNWK